jgi:hypothetical protein
MWDAARVRRPVITAAFFLLAACSGPAERQHRAVSEQSRLMEQIERQVQLSADAHELDDYARYYAIDGTRVVGTYVTYTDSRHDLPPGQNRWIDDHRNLPVILDGGCSSVNVVYDLGTRSVEKVFCNGVA